MATFEKRKRKDGQIIWRAKVRRKGYPEASATFTSKTKARDWAKATEAEMIEGRHFKYTEANRKTINDLLDRYNEEVLPRKRSAKSQRGVLEWWKNEIGHLKLADTNTSVIKECQLKLLRGMTPRGLRQPSTVNRYLALISHAFNVAIKEWEWIDKNPAENVKKSPESRGRVRFLSASERKALLLACQESPNKYLYSIVLLAISTGMRLGEIMNLTWDDINFLGRGIHIKETKNGHPRSIPIGKEVTKHLSELSKVRHLQTNLLFPSPTHLQTPIEIRKAWNNALANSGVENFRFHDLRHTAASYLAMNGATPIEIADILGHRTLQMVQRYSHLSQEHKHDLIDKMNSSIF